MSNNDKINQSQNVDNKLIINKKASGFDNSKRRLLKGAIGTTPVILAVTSKPVLAGWCTVSGFLSGNLSQNHGQERCGGLSPGYWKNHIDNCDEGRVQHDGNPLTKDREPTFYGLFGGVWRENDGGTYWTTLQNKTPTLREVLYFHGYEDQYEFGAHAIAAYMNAKYIQGYGMDVQYVLNLVGNVLVNGGFYEDPMTHKVLYADEIVDFIKQTF